MIRTRRKNFIAIFMTFTIIMEMIVPVSAKDVKKAATDTLQKISIKNLPDNGDIFESGEIVSVWEAEDVPGGTKKHGILVYYYDLGMDTSGEPFSRYISASEEEKWSTKTYDYNDIYAFKPKPYVINPESEFYAWRVVGSDVIEYADIWCVRVKLQAVAKTYNIVFKDGDETIGTPVTTYRTKKVVSVPKVTPKQGYNFLGWNYANSSTRVPSSVRTVDELITNMPKLPTPDKNGLHVIEIQAVWAGNPYKVHFDANGGTGEMPDQDFACGVTQSLTANTFTKKGFAFAGWNTVPDTDTATGTAYADKASVRDLTTTKDATVTLYAQWTPVKESKAEPNNNEKVEAATENQEVSEKKEEVKGSVFNLLQAHSYKYTKNSISLKWVHVTGADGYQIYGSKCNSEGVKRKYKLVDEITNPKTVKWTANDLEENTYYKFYIKAYKNVNGKKKKLTISKTIHATTISSKYGVAQSIKVNKSKVKLKKGKTFKIVAREINKDRRIATHRPICFESANKKIATVDENGVVKAKKKGTVKIWVYAQNGIHKAVKIKVK